MDTSLILIGVGCIIAAIIGGGVKLAQIEVGTVQSLVRQLLLGLFGLVLVISGLIAGGHLTFGGPSEAATNETDTLVNQTAPKPQSTTAVPYRVDIFWCVTDNGGVENQRIANSIPPALGASSGFGAVRVRPLSQATNAQSSYGITGNIVRFDPGERDTADRVAQIASQASEAAFAPAPALPGSPSINYLSVFVCAIH